MKKTLIALALLACVGMAEAKPYKLVSHRGYASWYNYRAGQLITASRDYPCGTVIKVFNRANKKFVIVTVRDWGPAAWTGRKLDLNRTAFNRIASLGTGEIKVTYIVQKIGHCRLHRH